MNYGYFDDKNKEYVITRPDTPSPWMNYLGNGKFSGMISNNAGGLVFDSDPGSHRITKYNHSGVPMDRPGHYLYLRDMDSGEYWSASWQPVMRDMQDYECRHGLYHHQGQVCGYFLARYLLHPRRQKLRGVESSGPQ